MNTEQARTRINSLRKEIEHHRINYHVHDTQEIAESVLDGLKHELVLLEQQFPQFASLNSPSQRVAGQVLQKFQKHEHTTRMVSLEDVFNVKELQSWQKRNANFLKPGPLLNLDSSQKNYFCELKLDGLALSLIYKNQKLEIGATRGNGFIGENVTHSIKTIQDIPLELTLNLQKIKKKLNIVRLELGDNFCQKMTENINIEVRGEALLKNSVFSQLRLQAQKQGTALFANARNMAAGSIRQLDSSITAQRRLSFYAWDLITDLGQKNHEEAHILLEILGFQVVKGNKAVSSLEEVQQFHTYFFNHRQEQDFNFDGIVVVVNNNALHAKLGIVGKAPRYMVAYKFPAEEVPAKVLDINLNIGRTGKVTPVAQLEPTLIYGVTVQNATLHNQDEINRLDIKIGDTAVVRRAGDVIPEVVQVLPGLRNGTERDFQMPKDCPSCGSRLIRKDGQVDIFCPNRTCPDRIIRYLEYFTSKAAFNIEGLGPGILVRLVKENIIVTESDIFKITISDIEQLEGFGEKSAQNIVNSIQKSKQILFNRFIYALGISNVGSQTSLLLTQHIKNLDQLLSITKQELEAIPEIGGIIAESIVEFVNDSFNRKSIQTLLKNGVEIIYSSIQKNASLDSKIVVFTGGLETISRDAAAELVLERGGKVTGSVSSHTSFVVAGDSAGLKLQKAQDLGVTILTEQEFLSMIGTLK